MSCAASGAGSAGSPTTAKSDSGESQQGCIFCRIVKNEVTSYKVWENDKFLAFLSIYPNTPGVTVVIPKDHYGSNPADVPEDIFIGLTLAARKVSALLVEKLEGVGRVAMVLEGFGVDHLHAKLFPMHGTDDTQETWRPIKSDVDTQFDTYPGYISTHDAQEASAVQLAAMQGKITGKPEESKAG